MKITRDYSTMVGRASGSGTSAMWGPHGSDQEYAAAPSIEAGR